MSFFGFDLLGENSENSDSTTTLTTAETSFNTKSFEYGEVSGMQPQPRVQTPDDDNNNDDEEVDDDEDGLTIVSSVDLPEEGHPSGILVSGVPTAHNRGHATMSSSVSIATVEQEPSGVLVSGVPTAHQSVDANNRGGDAAAAVISSSVSLSTVDTQYAEIGNGMYESMLTIPSSLGSAGVSDLSEIPAAGAAFPTRTENTTEPAEEHKSNDADTRSDESITSTPSSGSDDIHRSQDDRNTNAVKEGPSEDWYEKFESENDWDRFREESLRVLGALDEPSIDADDRDALLAQLIQLEEEQLWSKKRETHQIVSMKEAQQPKSAWKMIGEAALIFLSIGAAILSAQAASAPRRRP